MEKKDGMKFCWRHCHWVVEQCEVCESCPDPEDLACDESEDQWK